MKEGDKKTVESKGTVGVVYAHIPPNGGHRVNTPIDYNSGYRRQPVEKEISDGNGILWLMLGLILGIMIAGILF